MSRNVGGRFQRTVRARKLADPETHGAFEDARQAIDEIREDPMLNGRILERADPNDKASRHISLTPAATGGAIVKIPHGLGRPLAGFEKVDEVADSATAAGKILRVTVDGSGNVCDESKEIWLRAYGYTGASAVKVRIKVF